jgi:hypothetical protein
MSARSFRLSITSGKILASLSFFLLMLIAVQSVAQSVTITSPASNSTSLSAVQIAAYASNEPPTFDHYEIWDNNNNSGGYKLGTVPKTSTPNAVYVLPNGTHTLSVLAVTAQGGSGGVLNQANVTFTVAESCTDSSTVQCNFDQQGIASPQSNCNPPQEDVWVGNPCGAQGSGTTQPASISIQTITEAGTIPDAGNTTLNGKSLLLAETQASGGYSNVIFVAGSPTTTGSTVDSHWVLDEYVYLPNPAANQALEVDAYYVIDNVWTSFTTQCTFIYSNGPGYWAVYGGGGTWAYLNGSNGAPTVPCSTSQFSTPWPNSGNPSFTGWHHIVWTFLRNNDSHGNGYVTYVSLKFDGTTYNLNYTPTYETPGSGSNNGDFSALVQLDGTANASLDPEVYVNELNITHTP